MVRSATSLTYLNHGGTPMDPSDDTTVFFDQRDGFPLDRMERLLLPVSNNGLWLGDTYFSSSGTPEDKTDDIWFNYSGLGTVQAIDENGNLWCGGSGGLTHVDINNTPATRRDDTLHHLDFVVASGSTFNWNYYVGRDIVFDGPHGAWSATRYGIAYVEYGGGD